LVAHPYPAPPFVPLTTNFFPIWKARREPRIAKEYGTFLCSPKLKKPVTILPRLATALLAEAEAPIQRGKRGSDRTLSLEDTLRCAFDVQVPSTFFAEQECQYSCSQA
jgi:hypothetical protein